jgi:acyl-coenzyme A synthetase/AMP-(fatty) acid ligase
VVKALEYVSVSDKELSVILAKHVADHKANYKWLRGGVEFLDVIPKSPSGKILRRLLRDKEKEANKAKLARL